MSFPFRRQTKLSPDLKDAAAQHRRGTAWRFELPVKGLWPKASGVGGTIFNSVAAAHPYGLHTPGLQC